MSDNNTANAISAYADSAIYVSGLTKEYRGRRVLSIPALSLEKGRRYAILGANGSGKSTFLKILAGIEKPTSGTISALPDGKRAVGYLPQTPYGFSFSVLKNVTVAIGRSAERKTIALDALGEVGMTSLKDANASRLSGGETQRMAFARIISVPRKLLLLDEPTAAADLGGIDLLEKVLLRYYENNDCSVVFITHAPAQAARLADEVIFLHQGEIAEMGQAKQVLYEPQSDVARKFFEHWRM